MGIFYTMPIEGEKKLHNTEEIGTLAIDLGNSTTVVAFQAENNKEPILLDLPTLTRIEGEIPSPIDLPSGCTLHPRCPDAIEKCSSWEPELITVAHNHTSSCLMNT